MFFNTAAVRGFLRSCPEIQKRTAVQESGFFALSFTDPYRLYLQEGCTFLLCASICLNQELCAGLNDWFMHISVQITILQRMLNG